MTNDFDVNDETLSKILNSNANNDSTKFDLSQLRDALGIPNEELDDVELDHIAYINRIFPNETSLSNLDKIMDKIEQRIKDIDFQLDLHYNAILDDKTSNDEKFKNLDNSVFSLINSIEETLSKSDDSSAVIHNTLHDVMKYNKIKEDMEQTSQILNNLLYLIEYSKKLKTLIESKDFIQISTMLDVFESIYPTLDCLNRYEKVNNILSEYLDLRKSLQDILLNKVDDEIIKVSFNAPPDSYGGVFACINSMDQEFQDIIISKIIEKFENDIQSVFESLFEPLDSINFHHSIVDLDQWISKYLEKIFDFNKSSKMPFEWQIVYKISFVSISRFSNIYEEASKQNLFKNFSSSNFLSLFESIKKLDDTIKSANVLAKTNPLEINEISSKNIILLDDLMSAIQKDFVILSNDTIKEPFILDFRLKITPNEDEHPLLVDTRKFFEFVREKSIFIQFFDPSMDICHVFNILFQSMMNTFFSQKYYDIMRFIKLFHIKLFSFQVFYIDLLKVNSLISDINKNDHIDRLKAQFSSQNIFERFEYPFLIKDYLQAVDKNDIKSNQILSSINQIDYSFVIKELSKYLLVFEFAYDSIDSLESFLRMSSEIKKIETISFSSQLDYLILSLDSTNSSIANIVISECSKELKLITSTNWYDKLQADYKKDSSEEQPTSQYVYILIKRLKEVISNTRELLDNSRNHFIHICKLIVLRITHVFLYTVLIYHQNLINNESNAFENSRQQLLADIRLISAFLVSMPILNSNLSIEDIPQEYTNYATNQTNHLLSIINILISQKDSQKNVNASNFDCLKFSTQYRRIFGKLSFRNFFDCDFTKIMVYSSPVQTDESQNNASEENKDEPSYHTLIKIILIWKYGPEIGNDIQICKNVFDIVNRKS